MHKQFSLKIMIYSCQLVAIPICANTKNFSGCFSLRNQFDYSFCWSWETILFSVTALFLSISVWQVEQLVMFLLVLIVFLVAYGVASQGLLYHRRIPDWSILRDVIYFPYFQLFGELFLDEFQSMGIHYPPWWSMNRMICFLYGALK